MRPRIRSALILLALLLASCRSAPEKDFGRPLPEGAAALLPLPEPQWPDMASDWYQRDEIRPALDRSIAWMRRPGARRFFPVEGIRYERALASLERFRDILATTRSPAEFETALHREFQLYRSAGWDGRGGGVLFTAYCTPILEGSLEPTAEYRHPLYGLPPDLVKGPNGEILGRATGSGLEPYPTRRAIEASHLLANSGLELVWLRTPLDAYIAHVNGSAFVRLPDGSLARFGYAGSNGHEYTSLAKELVAAGELPADQSNLAAIRRWAARHPGEVEAWLARNDRYVFFTPIEGNPRGSLNVEVTPGRTLATDKRLFPRAALCFVTTRGDAALGDGPLARFVLDQDTGGGIRTAGRADLYLGIGPEAERRAGAIAVEGQLDYLFLRE